MITTTEQQFHRAVVTNEETGLYHGAIFQNYSTPSGCDRWLLRFTTRQGFFSQRKAAEEANKIDIGNVPALDTDQFNDVPEEIPDVPIGVEITLITPHNKKEKPYVQYFLRGERKANMRPEHLEFLIRSGIVELDSTSGHDPELSATYDHYVVVPDKWERFRESV